MNASTVSALLAQRAEAVCRKYLPNGKKQGRYWCAGDARGASGRSLFRAAVAARVRRASGPTRRPASTATCWISSGSPPARASLREALAEARRFLAQPAAAPRNSDRDTYDHTAAARNLWARCGPIDSSHAEAYLAGPRHSPLPVPGIAVSSLASHIRPMRAAGAAFPRWSPP